jgi:hypothetical protein
LRIPGKPQTTHVQIVTIGPHLRGAFLVCAKDMQAAFFKPLK